MKRIIALIIAVVAFSVTTLAETIDLGVLSLDTDYALTSFKGYRASFTPAQSGVLTMSSTSTDDLPPFSDEACTKELSVTKNGQYGAHSYDLKVEAGTTYYFYKSFIMNSNTTIRLTMSGKQEITLESSSPEIGGVFNVSNGGQISFNFSKAVAFTGATITIDGSTQKLAGAVSNTGIFFNDTKELIWNALREGNLKPGEKFNITLSGVSMSSDKTVLYDGTGMLSADFIVGLMPITLESTENTSGDFLSYYTSTNNNGIVKFHFSGKVNPEKLGATLKYGSLDKDPEGGYYQESLVPSLSEDSMTVIVNLQGKRRKVTDMITSGDSYDTITLGITGVMDPNGNYAYASGSGSLGSYWYAYTYKEITANVVVDFSPANGSDLTSSTKNLEIWISDEAKLSYDGVQFGFETSDGIKDTLLVADVTKEKDPDDVSAMILSVPVPEKVKTAKNIAVSFRNLQCADGSDYSNILRAKYNSFIISRITPVAGATLDSLVKGQTVKIYTNKTSATSNLKVTLRDLKPVDGDVDVLLCVVAEKSSDGKYFSFSVPQLIRLEMGHEYRLETSAFSAEGDSIGADYIIYNGHASVFRYSDVLLSSVTPDPATTKSIPQDEDLTVNLLYDGLVRVTSQNYTPVAVTPDSEGYATEWTITVPENIIESLFTSHSSLLSVDVLALDIDGNRVQGNTGYKDNNIHVLTYTIESSTAISLVEDKQTTFFTCYNLAGQRIDTHQPSTFNPQPFRGIVVVGGRKVLVK